MDWNVIIVGAFLSGVSAAFLWLTQRFIPDREKRLEAAILREFEFRKSAQGYNETTQGTALGQTLTTQKQLIDHVIHSNNGALAELTASVRNLADKVEKINAAFNFLIVMLSRSQASPPITNVKDWGNVTEIMEAIINSDAEEGISDLSAAAAKGKTTDG